MTPIFFIPAESNPGCMFSANSVIPAQIYDELLCGQAKVYGQTDRRTDRQTDGRRQRQYPFGLKGQWVINHKISPSNVYALYMYHVYQMYIYNVHVRYMYIDEYI